MYIHGNISSVISKPTTTQWWAPPIHEATINARGDWDETELYIRPGSARVQSRPIIVHQVKIFRGNFNLKSILVMVVFKNWGLTCISPSLQNPIQRQGVLVKVGLKRLFWYKYFQNYWLIKAHLPLWGMRAGWWGLQKVSTGWRTLSPQGWTPPGKQSYWSEPSLFAAWYCRRFDKTTPKLSKTPVGISNLVKSLIFKTVSAFEDPTIKDYIFTSPVPTWLCMFWPTGRSAT